MSRDDTRYGEDACVAFAIYCDTNGLTLEQGQTLAERVGDGLIATADDRAGYLSPGAANSHPTPSEPTA